MARIVSHHRPQVNDLRSFSFFVGRQSLCHNPFMMRAGTPATTVLGATSFVMTAPSPKALGWPNEVSPQGRKSPSGHHRLLVPGRRFAQAEHRHGHPDRLRPRRTRNAPASKPSGSPTSNARSFAKQSHKRVRCLEQDRVARRGGKADPLAGGSPPRVRPARLRGNHGRPLSKLNHVAKLKSCIRIIIRFVRQSPSLIIANKCGIKTLILCMW